MATEASPVQAYALATRLLTTLAQPVMLPGQPGTSGAVVVHLNASVGLTDLAGASDSDEVLRRADLALRRAKQIGTGKVEWYDEALERTMLRRMMLEQDLPGALVRGELVTFHGRWHDVDDAVLIPPPPRPARLPGRLPILIAAKGERVLRLTARFADAWNTAWFGTPD